MRQCPNCGEKFNWLQRAVGEHKEHMKTCKPAKKHEGDYNFAATCRGCPAGCFEGEKKS